MRRDHFTVETDPARDPPAVSIAFDGPAGTLAERLSADGVPPAEDVDVILRLQGPVDDPDTTGVLSLTRRLTGEYLLEVNGEATGLLGVVSAAREAKNTYAVRIERPADEPVVYEQGTLLVYDEEGSLLRQHSLIPSGVEL
ncbi:MAG: hypothetical protein ACI9CA_000829 [Natronomonas sp.]|jgi:hypothetical protein